MDSKAKDCITWNVAVQLEGCSWQLGSVIMATCENRLMLRINLEVRTTLRAYRTDMRNGTEFKVLRHEVRYGPVPVQVSVPYRVGAVVS